MKSIILAFMLSLVCVTVFSQTDESRVLQKVKDLNDAVFGKKDGKAIQGLVSDKLSYGHSDAKIEDKATMIQNAVENKITYRNVEMLSPTVVMESNTAVVRYVLNGVQTDSTGKEGPLTLAVLQVWMKEKKEWKLLARQAVKIPQKN